MFKTVTFQQQMSRKNTPTPTPRTPSIHQTPISRPITSQSHSATPHLPVHDSPTPRISIPNSPTPRFSNHNSPTQRFSNHNSPTPRFSSHESPTPRSRLSSARSRTVTLQHPHEDDPPLTPTPRKTPFETLPIEEGLYDTDEAATGGGDSKVTQSYSLPHPHSNPS